MEHEFIAEIYRALKRLGSSARPRDALQAYAALERAGADRFLLAAVGSWRDTMDDEAVIELLRDLNAERPALDEVYASSSEGNDFASSMAAPPGTRWPF